MDSTTKISVSDYPIKSVTVFKSTKAEVVRTFPLELKKGQNRIEIRGLPSAIDTQSVRVSGLGEARLFDVVCGVGDNKSLTYDPNSPSELVRLLKVKREALESEKRVRDHEANLLLNYAGTLNGEHVAPELMGEFLDDFVNRGRKNLEAVTALREQIVEIDRQIEKEEDNLVTGKKSTNGQVTVVIVAQENNAVELKLTYIVGNVQWHPTYELHASTENGKQMPSVTLHYRAHVRQSTGEDWKDTILTLSTVASDLMVTGIPQLSPIKITPSKSKRGGFQAFSTQSQNLASTSQQSQSLFGQQQQAPSGGLFAQRTGFGGSLFGQPQASSTFGQSQPQQQAPAAVFGQPTGFGAFGSGAATLPPHAPPAPLPVSTVPDSTAASYGESDDVDESFEEVAIPGALTEPTTIVTETPLAISYSVEGQSTIPSDNVAHQVSVAVLPFDAKISHVCVPRRDARVYMQCDVKNTSEYRLLAGFVNVILDDSFVSKTSIGDINAGDIFHCTFGADVAMKVTYTRTPITVRTAGGAFSEETNTTTYTTKITVHNKHQFAISDLVIRDVIPTSGDRRVKVILRKPEGLADAKDGQVIDLNEDGLKVAWEKLVDGKGGEKEGKFEWRRKVDGGAKIDLEAKWEVKAPVDVQWVESITSNGLSGRSKFVIT